MHRISARSIPAAIFTVALLLAHHSVCAQQSAAPAAVPTPSPAPQGQPEGRLARWIDLQTVTFSLRYRLVENSSGVTTASQLQHNEAIKGRFKFDSGGKYSINFGVFSGNNFIGSWNNTGAGTGSPFTNLYLKQLYFSARPIRGVEFQYGGLYVQRGESTEITTYDNDAYLTGERLVLKRPKELFLDEISVTYAYLGDISSPGLNKRYHRLKEANYHQFLVGKQLRRAAVSVDYTFVAGAETMREAVKLNTPELRVVDSVRFENYQRADVNPAYGFSLAGEKVLRKRLTLGGGIADIDRNYGGLNSDRFNRGRRLFASGSYLISPSFSVSTFYSRSVGNDYAISNRTRFDLVFSYHLLPALQRLKIF
ncbi:MAG: hypothetical protein U0Z53_07735 [Blastocatellia bacterium]